MKVIHPNNLPTRPPILLTAVNFLALDRLQPPGWIYGVTYTILALLWIASIFLIVREKRVDIFTD